MHSTNLTSNWNPIGNQHDRDDIFPVISPASPQNNVFKSIDEMAKNDILSLMREAHANLAANNCAKFLEKPDIYQKFLNFVTLKVKARSLQTVEELKGSVKSQIKYCDRAIQEDAHVLKTKIITNPIALAPLEQIFLIGLDSKNLNLTTIFVQVQKKINQRVVSFNIEYIFFMRGLRVLQQFLKTLNKSKNTTLKVH